MEVIVSFLTNPYLINQYKTLFDCAMFRTNTGNMASAYEDSCKYRRFSYYVAAFFSQIMTIVGLFVNTLSIYYFNKNTKQTRHKVFMISLAVSDIMANIFWVYIYLFPSFVMLFISGGKYYWILSNKSDFLCKLMYTMLYFWQQISFLILLFCSIDRFLSIMMPLESRNWGYKYAIFIIFGAIVWNLLSSIPHILLLKIYYIRLDEEVVCLRDQFQNYNDLYLI